MTRDEALKQVKEYEPTFLQKAHVIRGKQSYVCPACGNGTGASKTGITYNRGRYKCFKCGLYEDIFGLWMMSQNQSGKEAFDNVIAYYGLIDSGNTVRVAQKPIVINHVEDEKPKKDYTAYFRTAAELIDKVKSYRGISRDTLKRYGIGADEHFTQGTGGREWKAVIIPTSPHSFVARNTDKRASKENRYRKVGESELFNPSIIGKEESPVFIVEGEIDALSIIEAGRNAAAMGSTANAHKLIEYIKAHKPKHELFIALDNDDAGREASAEIIEELRTLGIPCKASNPYGTNKDANEALTADREAFIKALEAEIEVAAEEKKSVEDEKTNKIIEQFRAKIYSRDYEPIPTGIKKLDEKIGGGLVRQWLVMLSAEPGAGKTALAMQILEHIAQTGQQCLYINLEMSRDQLIARSISKDIFQTENEKISANDILRAYNCSEEQKIKIENGIERLADRMQNMQYNPDEIGTDIGSITDYMNKAAAESEKAGKPAPIVCIDYLQYITGESKEDTITLIKRCVKSFKDYAIAHKTIVICISAQSRAVNDSDKPTMSAGRDSSNIEYTADLLLQLMKKTSERTNRALHVNKARFAAVNMDTPIGLDFDGACSMFKDIEEFNPITKKELPKKFSDLPNTI